MTDYLKPLPIVSPLTQPFWDGARSGRLVVQKCGDCGKHRFPASTICDACLSEQAAWVEVSGQATVWSVCEFHRVYFKGFANEIPYNVALVRLDEGPRMYTNLVGISYGTLTATNNFFGFRNIVFNQLTALTVSSDSVFLMDNLQTLAAVPEPETLAMMLAGLGIVGVAARRRRN